MAKNYVLIDVDKLRKDVKSENKKIGDGLTVSKRLDENGIGNAAFANAETKLSRDLKNKKIDMSKYEECGKPASMEHVRLNAICLLFNLNKDDYILKFKSETEKKELRTIKQFENIVNEKNKKEIEEIKNKIAFLNDQVCLIGNVLVKNMEYLKEISERMQQLNDKWK